MHNMAIENGAERHWSEALQLTEQVVQRCKSKLGGAHPDTLALVIA